MKEFLFKTAFVVLPTLIFLVLVNYIGDSARIFDDEYESKIANMLHSGHYVTNISDYDERLFQKEFIKKVKQKPDIVVIGSSRTMFIRDEYFQNQLVINSSVSGASVEDLIAIYQIYKSSNILPNRIIIGVDPWIFNSNNGQKRWHSIAAFYNDFKGSVTNKRLNLFKYKQIISISYFQSSLNNIPFVIAGNDEPKATLNKLNLGDTRLLDGSANYGKKKKETSAFEASEKARSYISGEIYGFKNFNKISEEHWIAFSQLLEDMQVNNIEVSLFLTPYHPIVYDKLNNDYPIVPLIETRLIDFAKKENLNVYGSFDPRKYELTASHFYDGMHCNEEALQLILNN
jgi:hypothetical protein